MTYRTFDGTSQEETIVDGRFSSSGDIALSDGSATQGAIYFADDKNTGIYSPSNNQIAFTTDGSANVILGGSALVHIKAGSQQWSQGLLLEDSAGGDGWNFYPDPDSGGEFFIGYNDDVVGSPDTSTTVFKLKGSDKSATFSGDVNCKDIILTDEHPMITFTDNNENPDFRLKGNSGAFEIEDVTNDTPKLTIYSSGTVFQQNGTTAGGNYNLALKNTHAGNDYSLLYFQSTDSGSSTSTTASIKSKFVGTGTTNGKLEIQTRNAGSLTTGLTLDETQNVIFAGNIGVGTDNPRGSATYKGLELNGTTGGVLTFSDDDVEKWHIYGQDGHLGVYDRANTRYNLKCNTDGSVELPEGHLKLADDKGIDFSAYDGNDTSGTPTGNILKDYEEGTWTPGFAAGFNATGLEITNGTNGAIAKGWYTKIGDLVTAQFYMKLGTSGTSTTNGSQIKINGCPFDAQDTSEFNGGGNCTYVDLASTVGEVSEVVATYGPDPGTAIVQLYRGSQAYYASNAADQSGKYIIGMITYKV
jgi:hypothetical protein